MILTVTLNPAVDKTYTADSLILGQVNRMQSAVNIAGGKGINVTKILRQYGCRTAACGLLGGYTGLFIDGHMREIGTDCRFTKIEGETRSNINVIAKDGYVTEILEPGPEISESELKSFIDSYKEAVKECECIVMSGSAAKSIPADIYKRLIVIGNECGKKCILDTSGEALRCGIEAHPYMIKPNHKELEYLIGHKLTDIEEIIKAAEKLRCGGIELVVVSMGSRGLLSISETQALWARAPFVKAVNTVGCGDSVVASYAMSFIKGEDIYTSLKRAAATAAANAATLRSGEFSAELAEELFDEIQIERRK